MLVKFYYDITDPSTCVSRSPYVNDCNIPTENVVWTCLLRDDNNNAIGEATFTYSSTSFIRKGQKVNSTQGYITYYIYELETSFNELYRDVEFIDNDLERKRKIVSTDGKFWNVCGYVSTKRLLSNRNVRQVVIKFYNKN